MIDLMKMYCEQPKEDISEIISELTDTTLLNIQIYGENIDDFILLINAIIKITSFNRIFKAFENRFGVYFTNKGIIFQNVTNDNAVLFRHSFEKCQCKKFSLKEELVLFPLEVILKNITQIKQPIRQINILFKTDNLKIIVELQNNLQIIFEDNNCQFFYVNRSNQKKEQKELLEKINYNCLHNIENRMSKLHLNYYISLENSANTLIFTLNSLVFKSKSDGEVLQILTSSKDITLNNVHNDFNATAGITLITVFNTEFEYNLPQKETINIFYDLLLIMDFLNIYENEKINKIKISFSIEENPLKIKLTINKNNKILFLIAPYEYNGVLRK